MCRGRYHLQTQVSESYQFALLKNQGQNAEDIDELVPDENPDVQRSERKVKGMLLTLDGGGIRGALMAIMLYELESVSSLRKNC